jgi:hypothetical protein
VLLRNWEINDAINFINLISKFYISGNNKKRYYKEISDIPVTSGLVEIKSQYNRQYSTFDISQTKLNAIQRSNSVMAPIEVT